MIRCQSALSLALSLVLAAAPQVASAQESWPARALHIVLPSPPGGGIDVVARVVAAGLAERLGQQVIVENRPGARNIIGVEAVARAAPDGYTLLVMSDAYTVMPFLERKLPFQVPGSFTPVSQLALQPLVLAVHPSVPARSVSEFVALARSTPGGLPIGTGAFGHYLAAVSFAKAAGFPFTHVPYKGGPPAIVDLVGGQVPAALTGQLPLIPHVRSGRVRGLAVLSKRRSLALPDLPTLEESGVGGIDLSEWIFMLAPAGTPREIVGRLNAEVRKVLEGPEAREQLVTAGFEPAPGTPAELGGRIDDALQRWGRLVPQLEIRPE